jgi:hypothetical protein
MSQPFFVGFRHIALAIKKIAEILIYQQYIKRPIFAIIFTFLMLFFCLSSDDVLTNGFWIPSQSF